jgi:hypothetical protein
VLGELGKFLMSATYLVSLVVRARTLTCSDIDLPLLLQHADGAAPLHGFHLAARDDAGRPIPAQWLESGMPSAVAGKRSGSLILGAASSEHVALLVQAGEGPPQAAEVQFKESPAALEAMVSDKPFFTYRYNTKDPELPRPIFHPLLGPSGKTITQLGEVPGKRVAHFHHTGLWIAHQNWAAKGQPNCDNWQMNKNCTKIDHVKFEKIESGPLAARFIEKLRWLNTKGDTALLEETRTVTVPKRPAASRVLDIEIALKCGEVPVTFNRTPYHLLAARVLDAMLPKNGGAMTNSEGKKDPPDGAPAAWIDISGKLDGEEQGVALFNHPRNDRHPTPCLQFSGQTIGLSPTHKEPLTVEAGKEVRFRYRVLVHAGNVEEGKVAAEYEAYSKAAQARIGGIERLLS